MLVIDSRNPQAVRVGSRLSELLPESVLEAAPHIVVGGDGFLLRTAAAGEYTGSYLGLNTGNLGFLLNDVGDIEATAKAIAEGQYEVYAFPLLSAQLVLENGEERTEWAMNEAYLERATGQAARLSLTVDGHVVVDNLVADGLIVSTALGSTAYSFSAGGSPAHPRLRLLKITPICPHLPRLTPFDLPADALVEVEVLFSQRRPVRAVLDGRSTEAIKRVRIERSERTVELAYLSSHHFTGHLLNKIVIP